MEHSLPNLERSRGAAHWIVLAAALLAPVTLVAGRVLLTPSPAGHGTHTQLGLPPCQTMNWFGVPCPGCGVTTSFAWFAHADPWESLRTQPLGFAIGMAALLAAPLAVLAHVRGLDLGEQLRARNRYSTWFAVGVFAAAAWGYKLAVVWLS